MGILAASYLPVLPPISALILLLPGFFLVRVWRSFFYLWLFLGGLGWGIYAGHQMLSHQLDVKYEGQTLQVSGWIEDIPNRDYQKTRFSLRIDHIRLPENTKALDQHPEKIQLSWYARGNQTLPPMVPGDYWQFKVRLKRPRGFVNPGGFDYQAWLLRRGIGATGYVLSGDPAGDLPHPNWLAPVDHWRWQLQQWVLANCHGSECGILVALLIGDTSHVDKAQWQRMQQTGTSHLIAISGLHVGFLAIVGYWCGLFVGKLMQLMKWRIPAQRWAYSFAIVFAAFYSALAGFNIPTLRTLIMIAVFDLMAFWYRPVRLSHIYFFALVLVLLVDPLAAFDMGFWLSFGAVAVLLVSFSGRYHYMESTKRLDAKVFLWSYTRSQWVLFIGLLVPLGVLVNTSPLLAPIANFIAIPLVTFFVVPCLLLGATLSLLGSGQAFVWLAEQGMALLKFWLEGLCKAGQGEWEPVLMPVLAFSPLVVVLLVLVSLVLLLPRGILPRWLGYVGLLLGLGAGFLPKANPPALALRVMDVGQGTAVVVSTPNHHLVYDTGPRYSEDFDAGSSILLPYLRSQGIRHLDAIVVSHGDMDHAGGLEGLMAGISFSRLYQGEPELSSALNCHTQEPWQWDGINFRFLHWPISTNASANNHSCLLLIEYDGQRILLPGDIEASAEWTLLRGDELPGKLTLLLAAHHGSRSSSNPAFVAYTQPEWVVYSAGYKNQHGHPHPLVQERFDAQNSHGLNTALQGAILFRWWPGQDLQVSATRQQQRRYWYEPIAPGYVLP
jgi:competence protein ComEC